ncbi:MAG: hypothetical protein IJK63_12545 [Oscillospiraceae bacterium]|nr:hypothetical protein [Oscillospiraceae bacterium]
MIKMILRTAVALGLAILAFSQGADGAGVIFMICGLFFGFYSLWVEVKEGGTTRYTPKADNPQVPAYRFVCKSCGKMRTGWYKVCPDCGAKDSMEKLRQPVAPEPVSQPPVTPVPVTRQPDACIHTWVQDPKDCMARCSKCGMIKVSHNWQRHARMCREICTICGRGRPLPHRFGEDGYCEACGGRRTSFHTLALSSGKEFLALRRAVEIISKEEGWADPELLAWIGMVQEYTARELEILYLCVNKLLAHYTNDPAYESEPDCVETILVLGTLSQKLAKLQPPPIR